MIAFDGLFAMRNYLYAHHVDTRYNFVTIFMQDQPPADIAQACSDFVCTQAMADNRLIFLLRVLISFEK